MDRFEDKFVPEPNSGCWLWIASCRRSGYGCFGYEGKVQDSHRVSYKLYKGSIPDGLCVLHRCDVRCCVNPNHLFLGTKQDNSNDMVNKGRWKGGAPRGESNGMSKLTSKDVYEIRDLCRHSPYNQREIAKLYDISFQHVNSLILNKRWIK